MTFAGQAAVDGRDGAGRTHFVLVPLMAQGHTIPMSDMARLLAEHGARVRFVTTPMNASRMAGFVDAAAASGLPVELVQLRFPAAEFGLPEGCENADMIPSWDLFKNFMEACAALLREQCLPPICIISNVMQWWTGDIARDFGIPRLTFQWLLVPMQIHH